MEEKCKKCGRTENVGSFDGLCENCRREDSELSKRIVLFFIIVILFVFIIFPKINNNSSSVDTSDDSSKNSSSSGEPSDFDLMCYAQTVIEDYVGNAKFSSSTSDYNFVKTNLRYKIEGKVTSGANIDKFYLIIKFTDNNYQEYDVISLQVGSTDYV